LARKLGAEVMELDLSLPFTAARARNTGFQALMKSHPQLKYVHFVDGDSEIIPDWLDRARSVLEARPDTAVVFGRRRERFPDASIFNRMCDIEWNSPIGESAFCGGDALMRVEAFQAVNGFDPTVIAGEEPELCLRLRRRDWKILRIDADMTMHDAAMTRFNQWWKRAIRCGYAYSLGASMHGAGSERHFVRERRRVLLWALVLPVFVATCAWPTNGWGLLFLLLYPFQVARVYGHTRRRGISPRHALLYGISCVVAKFPELIGVCKHLRDRMSSQPARIIEYK
jgi:cellulose synthase/poly-beta-1,6-N-acetylglucosamine synthase-like glycosyltransferase